MVRDLERLAPDCQVERCPLRLGVGVWGLAFGASGFGFWVLGFGSWVLGLGFGVWGYGFGVSIFLQRFAQMRGTSGSISG